MYIASSFLDGVETHGRIRVTDLERTIIDTIKDFTKVGGLEELLACLSLVTYIKEDSCQSQGPATGMGYVSDGFVYSCITRFLKTYFAIGSIILIKLRPYSVAYEYSTQE